MFKVGDIVYANKENRDFNYYGKTLETNKDIKLKIIRVLTEGKYGDGITRYIAIYNDIDSHEINLEYYINGWYFTDNMLTLATPRINTKPEWL